MLDPGEGCRENNIEQRVLGQESSFRQKEGGSEEGRIVEKKGGRKAERNNKCVRTYVHVSEKLSRSASHLTYLAAFRFGVFPVLLT